MKRRAVTIEEIEAMEIKSHAVESADDLAAINDFLLGKHPMVEKVRALRKLYRASGNDGEVTEESVRRYVGP